jgi:hypothetical protein
VPDLVEYAGTSGLIVVLPLLCEDEAMLVEPRSLHDDIRGRGGGAIHIHIGEYFNFHPPTAFQHDGFSCECLPALYASRSTRVVASRSEPLPDGARPQRRTHPMAHGPAWLGSELTAA